MTKAKNAAPAPLGGFVRLGKAVDLTGKDENGNSGDGGQVKPTWVYKQSLGGLDNRARR
jgi:hypothetical protein